jgi:flagellar basal body-associated protein FliL
MENQNAVNQTAQYEVPMNIHTPKKKKLGLLNIILIIVSAVLLVLTVYLGILSFQKSEIIEDKDANIRELSVAYAQALQNSGDYDDYDLDTSDVEDLLELELGLLDGLLGD